MIITQIVLATQSSNMVHCNCHTPKHTCWDFQAFLNTFFPVQIDIFFIFCQGELSKQAKILHFIDFDWEKMHQNGLSGVYLGFEECQIHWCSFWVSTISGSWKIKISVKNFHILLILTWKNALEWLGWYIFRIQDMSNPKEHVSSLYNKWLLKSQSFRGQVA